MEPIKPKGSTPLLIAGIVLVLIGVGAVIAGSQISAPEGDDGDEQTSGKDAEKKPMLVERSFDVSRYSSLLENFAVRDEEHAKGAEQAYAKKREMIRKQRAMEEKRKQELEAQKEAERRDPDLYPTAAAEPETPSEALPLRDCEAPEKLSGKECNDLAMKYYRGSTLDERFAAHARELFRVACQLEDASGCSNHAYMAENGLGGPRRLDDAREYYATACNHDYHQACHRLGVFAYEGIGKPKDYREAYIYFKKGCSKNLAESCLKQGEMAQRGEGTEVDLKTARRVYLQACQSTNDHAIGNKACAAAGDMLTAGEGGEKDLELAKECYEVACYCKNQKACKAVEE